MMIFFWLEKFDDKNEVPWPTFSNLFFSSNNFKRRRRRVRPFEEDLRQQQPAVFPSPISTTNFSYPLKNLATKDRPLSCKNKILFFKSKIDSRLLVHVFLKGDLQDLFLRKQAGNELDAEISIEM